MTNVIRMPEGFNETEKRWVATVNYRHDLGPVDVEYFIEELDEISEIIEGGPHWDCVIDISIKFNRHAGDMPSLTVEESLKL
ncbi:MAG: hypothetical protein COB36_12250 [Alphaproteobacteria bacterium]|nr:MAG: hypothetical protein COB36_12250 [Alphaproteobacteria bacterium]